MVLDIRLGRQMLYKPMRICFISSHSRKPPPRCFAVTHLSRHSEFCYHQCALDILLFYPPVFMGRTTRTSEVESKGCISLTSMLRVWAIHPSPKSSWTIYDDWSPSTAKVAYSHISLCDHHGVTKHLEGQKREALANRSFTHRTAITKP
jgi:hypothetical protein